MFAIPAIRPLRLVRDLPGISRTGLSQTGLSRTGLSHTGLSRTGLFYLQAAVLGSCLVVMATQPAWAFQDPQVPTPQDSAVAADFFEKNVRPVLLAKCVECHGPDTQEAGVRLDSRAALFQSDDADPVINTETPEASKLLHVISYQHDVQMPPDGALPPAQVQALHQWVLAGAPWPESVVIGSHLEARMLTNRESHWAFQPIRREFPTLQVQSSSQHPVDQLIQAGLQAVGLEPSPPADDRLLVRRLYFTLLGLPPSPAELSKYMANSDPGRWEQLVDELLNRPQYGERWARHWLDVARYADTQGYAFANDRRYPHAYTYRDFVVRAFNEDLPYDEFVRQQLAADLLDLGDDLSPLAGLGFITVGRRFIDHNDTLDDRIDVVTRGLLGLTVSCARCHDHKYDAISAADYYALHGVMASSPDSEIKPPIGPRADVEARTAFEQRQRELQGGLDGFRKEQVAAQKQATIDRLSDYFLAVFQPPEGLDSNATERVSLSAEDLRPAMLRRWKDRLENFSRSRGNEGKWFRPLRPLMALPDEDFQSALEAQLDQWQDLIANPEQEPADTDSAAQAEADSESAAPEASPERPRRLNRRPINAEVLQKLREANLQAKSDVAQFYADLLKDVWKTFAEHGSNDRAVLQVEESLRFAIELMRGDSPLNIPPTEIGLYLNDAEYQRLQELTQELESHNATAPPELPRAMAVQERQPPVTPYVFLRGNPNNRGPEVPRRFLTLLTMDAEDSYPDDTSGRLQLAEQITGPNNPLTARVIANRIWMHHFGKPLVDTPSDFGVRCDPPLQSELLDYMANYLQQQNWSLKALHRHLLTSQTFRQSSVRLPAVDQTDPENRYFSHANRRRMEWEAFRDSLLAATGKLDLTIGGPAVDLFRDQSSNRRSLYGTIDRQDLPNLLRSFDFASPDTSVAVRPQTMVPQQSLYMLNGPLLQRLAREMLQDENWQRLDEPEQQLQWLFERLLLRRATEDEVLSCLSFLAALDVSVVAGEENPDSNLPQRWEMLVQTLLMSNEFCFVD